MKNTIILFITALVLFVSCEEGFEPTTDFKEDYIMYGILNGDSSYQTVVVSKSYSADNFDPYSNTTDPDIQNAVITITGRDGEYLLRDSSVERTDKSHYDSPQHFYYTNDFKPKIGEEVKIKAVLPNGKVLESETQLPHYSLFSWTDSDEELPISKLYDKVLFRWKLNNAPDDLVYLPRFLIHYFQNENGTSVRKTKEFPLNFAKIGGIDKEQFPNATGNTSVLYDTTIVYNTLKNLKGNGSASDITLIRAEIELTIMDKNFGSYYSSIQTLNDGFTIKIYEANYSNINGGIGVWGSYFTVTKDIDILEEFARRLGYSLYQ